jgi:DNA primase
VFGLADQIAEEHLSRVRIKSDYISAVCPFHKGGQERHPSFWVHRGTGAWGCFTCTASGSSIKYLLRELGHSSRKIEAEIEEAEKDADKIRKVSQAKRRRKAREGFEGEHVLPESLLGVFDYLPLDLVDAGFPEELLRSHDIGYDQRNDRITFPLRDLKGKLIGISGRSTRPGEVPKYLLYNGRRIMDGKEVLGELGEWFPQYSNESVRDHLWRIHFVYEDLMSRRWDQLIVVEGYKAAMWMVKHGWYHTVAVMGTKMTEKQERLIRHFGVEVFVFTDNNEPGQEAATNWCQRLAVSSFPVYRVRYPGHCSESAQPDDLEEQELDEVLQASERIGGRYVDAKRLARKQARRQREKPWRRKS